jgi:hypothetical protein
MYRARSPITGRGPQLPPAGAIVEHGIGKSSPAHSGAAEGHPEVGTGHYAVYEVEIDEGGAGEIEADLIPRNMSSEGSVDC